MTELHLLSRRRRPLPRRPPRTRSWSASCPPAPTTTPRSRAPARPGRGGGRRRLRRRAGGAARRGGRDRPGGRGRQDPDAAGTITAPLVVAVGLGPAGDDGPSAEQVRRASGAAARALAGTDHAVTHAVVVRPDPGADALAATAEGTLLGAYAFTDYKKAGGRKPVRRVDLSPMPPRSPTQRPCCAGRRRSPRPSPPPATSSTPRRTTSTRRAFAARAARAGRGRRAGGRGPRRRRRSPRAGTAASSGSAAGSSRKPRLVRLRWSGGPAPRASVALVGKGITFDTGGISIKPAAHMDHMTSDMAGAAAVVATTVLAARLELPVAVTATVPMAENMPSSTAYRPGDVLRMYGGRTVEVLNTDAEGRLILADAIVRALRGRARLPDRDLHAHRRPARRARAAHVGGDGQRRCSATGWRRWRRAAGEDAWAMPLPGPHPRRARLAGGRHRERHRAPQRRHAGGRDLPARVRAGRPAVGAHRHRRPVVPHGRAVRLHDEGRHGRPGADAGRRC